MKFNKKKNMRKIKVALRDLANDMNSSLMRRYIDTKLGSLSY